MSWQNLVPSTYTDMHGNLENGITGNGTHLIWLNDTTNECEQDALLKVTEVAGLDHPLEPGATRPHLLGQLQREITSPQKF